MSASPGTVSKILWHFTGGPVWNEKKNKQGKRLKPVDDSFKALKEIIKSNELRTGKYHEIVRTIIPDKKIFNLKTKKFEIKKNHSAIIKSSPVCCVAEIPIQHLDYLSKRYGKIAIGFHRDSIVKAGFNPVMYTLDKSNLSRDIHDGYSLIDNFNTSWVNSSIDDIQSNIDSIISDYEIDEDIDTSDARNALEDIEWINIDILTYYENLLAYIKTFEHSEFETIYCEREWRTTNNYEFTIDDIAMIILPKKGKKDFYNSFLKSTKLPRRVPVVSWEDLIEH